MKVFNHDKLPEVKIITLETYQDDRGYFYETYNKNKGEWEYIYRSELR